MAAHSGLSANGELERDVCRLVHQFARHLDAHVRRVGEQCGLTASQVVALRELSESMNSRELATRMSCEASNVTFVVDRLEQQGLVERRSHPTDRRVKQIVLTPEGRRCRATVLELLDAQSPIAPLTRTQQESLRDLLHALTAES
jgi:DNA-binding MarR family transcriptional regulator